MKQLASWVKTQEKIVGVMGSMTFYLRIWFIEAGRKEIFFLIYYVVRGYHTKN